MRLQHVAVLAQLLLVPVESVVKKYVYAGYCGGSDFGKNGFCSLESTSCPQDMKFNDAHSETGNGHSSNCHTRAKTNEVHIGYCGGDENFCTSIKENCKDEKNFVPNDGCRVKSKSSRFGSCDSKGGKKKCVWGPSDCDDPTDYIPAYENKELCKATDVQTGACVYKGKSTSCAVSSDGCSGSFQSIQGLALEKKIKCRLAVTPYYLPDPPTPQPTISKSFNPNEERMCDHDAATDFINVEDGCDMQCADVESCVSYQETSGVGCTLFSGTNTFKTGDRFDFSCRKKKKKKKKRVCDPRGMISLLKDLKLSQCKKACKKDTECKYHMLVKNDNCLLFGKKGKGRKSTEDMMEKFTCYTIQ